MSTLRFKAVEEVRVQKFQPDKFPSEYWQIGSTGHRCQISPRHEYRSPPSTRSNVATGNCRSVAPVKMWRWRWSHPLYALVPALTEGTAEARLIHDYLNAPGGDYQRFGKLLNRARRLSFPAAASKHLRGPRLLQPGPSSPAFITKHLCIPTVFISYTGRSLDYKTPLLKSLSAVDKAAVEVWCSIP